MFGRYSIISKNKGSMGSVRVARLLKQAEADERFNLKEHVEVPFYLVKRKSL